MNPLALLLLFALPPDAASQDHHFAEGEHLHAVCWFHSELAGDRLAEELRDVGEAAWEIAGAWIGLGSEPPEIPLTLNAFETRRDFRDAVEGIRSGASEGRTAWGDWESRQVHVRLMPVLSDRVLNRVGSPVGSLRGVAVEVARLALREASGGELLAPAWFADGLAAWVADRALVRCGRALEGSADPWFSTRILLAQELEAAGRAPLLEELLTDAESELAEAERRALLEVLFAHLDERLGEEEGWQALTPRISRGLSGSELLEALSEVIPLAELDRGWRIWLAQQEPPWEEEIASFSPHPEGWVQLARPKTGATCWVHPPAPATPHRIRGEFFIFPNKLGQAQVFLRIGRGDGDHLLLDVDLKGSVTLWVHEPSAAEAERAVARRPLEPRMQPRTWIPFEVSVLADEVLVEVGGREPALFRVRGRPLGGHWGVTTKGGCTTLWRGLECEPLESEGEGGGE